MKMDAWKHILVGTAIFLLSGLITLGAKSYVDLKHEQSISQISLMLGKLQYLEKTTDEIKEHVHRIWGKINR